MDTGSIFVVGSFVAACSVTVERLPRAGETLRASSFVLDPGGKGFNVAVGAHRLGAQVDGVLAVGGDLFGDFASAAVNACGLPRDMLLRLTGPTGAGVGFVDRHGENCIAVYPAANDLLSADDIASRADRLSRCAVVAAQFEVGDAPIVAAFAQARRRGLKTVLNCSPFRAVAPEMLGTTNILVVNRIEVAALAKQCGVAIDAGIPASWGELADHLRERGVQSLIVTLGAEGVVAREGEGAPVFRPAFAIEAVDTIGAGDAFLGGLLAALAQGLPMAEGLRWGAACGALVASRAGVLDALPDRVQLGKFLDRHPST
ncbi:ribokinase [Novosphingobium sp. 9U]|uniref:ribokinase n=1 Tax=Novosphingobium sp. 9U TaxID=2653158 RepID=UPI0012F1FD18|nr:ribokinase [Novosphingobium sp. 9U]VWX47157.1 Ribokinase [Novosphingobium sp. 9U]